MVVRAAAVQCLRHYLRKSHIKNARKNIAYDSIIIVTMNLLSQAVTSQKTVFQCTFHAPEHGEVIRNLVLTHLNKLFFFNGYNHCSIEKH
jgi:hypothetical protein